MTKVEVREACDHIFLADVNHAAFIQATKNLNKKAYDTAAGNLEAA